MQQFDGLLTTIRPFLAQEPRGAHSRRQQPGRRDQHAAAAGLPEWVGDRPARRCRPPRRTSTRSTTRRTARWSPFPAITFANPMQFICSSIQAGSRLGYQESAELCAQYLAPILDAIKFNYLPFGLNLFSTAETLPKEVAYSEDAAAAADRVQGHHRPGDLGAGYADLAPQHPTRLDRRPGHARAAGRADHRGPDDPRVADRTDGWPQHRARSVEPADPAGTARTPTTRTRSLPPVGLHAPVPIQPPPPGPEVIPGPVAPTPAPVSAPAPQCRWPAAAR